MLNFMLKYYFKNAIFMFLKPIYCSAIINKELLLLTILYSFCCLPLSANILENDTEIKVTYHSATEEDYVATAQNGQVAYYVPQDCPMGKVFLGWSEHEIPNLLDSKPDILSSSSGYLTGINKSEDLYAVYASLSGGQLSSTNINTYSENWRGVTYNADSHLLVGLTNWKISDNFSKTLLNNFTYSGTDYYVPVFEILASNTIYEMTSEQPFSEIKFIVVEAFKKTYNNGIIEVLISKDKIEWISIGSETVNGTVGDKIFEPENIGDYYVKIKISTSSSTSIAISNIDIWSPSYHYYHADYSTTCEVPEYVNIEWNNPIDYEFEIIGEQHQQIPTGDKIIIPGLVRDNYLFMGYKPRVENDEKEKAETYTFGESYIVGHDVSFRPRFYDTPIFNKILNPEEVLTTPKGISVTSQQHTIIATGGTINGVDVSVADIELVPEFMEGKDVQYFSVEIDEGVVGGKNKIFTYTFTYTPDRNCADTEHTATFRLVDKTHCTRTSPITLQGRTYNESQVLQWGTNSFVMVKPEEVVDNSYTVKIKIENKEYDCMQINPVNTTIDNAKNIKITTSCEIDFSLLSGQPILLNWYKIGVDEDKKVESLQFTTSLVVPTIIAANCSLSDLKIEDWSSAEIHILSDITLNVDDEEKIQIGRIDVYPNAMLRITNDVEAEELNLYCGWTRTSEFNTYGTPNLELADNAVLNTINDVNLYLDLYDSSDTKQHYFPFSVPFAVKVDDIKYADEYLAQYAQYGEKGQYVVKYYDGARRAADGENRDENWQIVEAGETLQPFVGYTICAIDAMGEAILRVPLRWGEMTRSVKVNEYKGNKTTDSGWNMLGVPSISFLQGVDITGTEIKFISIPTFDYSKYEQELISETKIKAFWSYFVQAVADETIMFGQTTEVQNSIISRRSGHIENIDGTISSPQPLRIELDIIGGNDKDKTTVFISDTFSADYELGNDLEKLFGGGNELSIYTIADGINLAFNSLPIGSVGTIPIGVQIPENGEYIISLSEKWDLRDIESLYLTDNVEGRTCDLVWNNYPFAAHAGQTNNRFVVEVKRKPKTPTSLDDYLAVNDGIGQYMVTSINRLIMLREIPLNADVFVYTIDGRMISKLKDIQCDRVSVAVPASGVYNVRVIVDGVARTNKVVVR